ncbi:MAG: thiamine phosphate synthase [Alphaproteobacteria bacterium]|nr:thiamine phosphate synthase [Alphaproteobacteria bacterium]
MRAETCQLYLITPPAFDAGGAAGFADTLAAALDGGEVACVQLRLKDVADDDIRRATEILCPVAQNRDVAFIMNDRADLAAELGCDGVHIGQDDTPYDDARRLVGDDAIVGVTCKASRELAFEAGEAGADYVAFGAFFPSTTKQVTTPADTGILSWWQEMMTVPCVAIGGITVENCDTIIDAGADFLAVGGGVWNYADGPAAAVKAFNAKMAAGD